MWDFSDDEWLVFVAAAAQTIIAGFFYYRSLDSVAPIGRSVTPRVILGFMPPVALLPAYVFMREWSDPRVAGHPDYITLFLVVGAAALLISIKAFGVLGVSVKEDVLERDNPAALIVVCSTMFAIGIIYAGANVGGGPTIWTTLLPAFAGILALAMLRLLVEIVGGDVFETITIDRDVSAALRLAGMMLGSAIILARAAGGEWNSWPQTWNDFLRFGWPAIIVGMIAGILNRMMRSSPTHPHPNVLLTGLLPAAGLTLISFGWVVICFDGLQPWKW